MKSIVIEIKKKKISRSAEKQVKHSKKRISDLKIDLKKLHGAQREKKNMRVVKKHRGRWGACVAQ